MNSSGGLERRNCRVVVLTDSGEAIDWLRGPLKDAGFNPFYVVNEEDLLGAASMPGVGLFLLIDEALERALPEVLFGIGTSRAASAPVIGLARLSSVLEEPSTSEFDVDDFMVSPWDAQDVVARVSALCGKQSTRRSTKPHSFCGFQFVHGRLAVGYAGRRRS